MEMERYRAMTEEQLREEFETNPVFDYMKLAYKISDAPKLMVTDIEEGALYGNPYEIDFKIFKKVVRGEIELEFSLNQLLYPKGNDIRRYIKTCIIKKRGRGPKIEEYPREEQKERIEKFWWAIVFVSVYADSVFKYGYIIKKSFLGNLKSIANVLSGDDAMLVCKSDNNREFKCTDAYFLKQLRSIINNFFDLTKNWDAPGLTNGEVIKNHNIKGEKTYQIYYETKLYLALFNEMENQMTLYKRNFDRRDFIAKLLVYTKLEGNIDYNKNNINGIMKESKYGKDLGLRSFLRRCL